MQEKLISMRVERAFLIRGVRQEVGSTVQVDRMLAGELRHAGKASPIPEEPASAGPLTTQSAPAMVRGARRDKESTHAQ